MNENFNIELTKEQLETAGFELMNPHMKLAKYRIITKDTDDKEFCITVEQSPIESSDEIGWNMSAWKCAYNNAIIKRVSAMNVENAYDLQRLIKLCSINYNFITKL